VFAMVVLQGLSCDEWSFDGGGTC